MIDNLFSFNGRLSRSGYWAISLCVAVVAGLLIGVLTAIGVLATMEPLFIVLFGLAIGVIGMSVSVRRFHDRNKSGWWYLIGFVPVIGGLWLVVENGFLKGTEGPNRYGRDPLGDAAQSTTQR
ncbi:DUF805 domain-containing protein [Crenobacter sp. SG2305]|uniref:DUF805 domain-containing protein n=1 Tax=Crenobacter oryzisoli TaxID=3056844 RepID=UPI0025AA6D09|nr:DUF805 domain-containing protein [Crenobacter sp. SG2305]MDN0083082.1 DUF805 domain-containing protein [Crenobacter sp. SG2305]